MVLCGEPVLCMRYASALEAQGLPTPEIRSGVTPLGLWRIAQAAELYDPPRRFAPAPKGPHQPSGKASPAVPLGGVASHVARRHPGTPT